MKISHWILASAGIALMLNTPAIASTNHPLSTFEKVVDTNAHEGPTCVPHLNRLYFTTKPNWSAKTPYTNIQYLDLGTQTVHTMLKHANMVNSMWLSTDQNSLLLAEQGTDNTPGGIASIDLDTKKRTVLINQFEKKPFNSPNKVILSKQEVIYFSDPNYGFLQSFKPKPDLHNAVYAYALRTEQVTRLTEDFVMPHGLGLSYSEDYLYIADSAALNVKSPIHLDAGHDIYRAKLLTPIKLGPLEHFITVKGGVPDGFIVLPNNDLITATTAGVYYYDASGTLKSKQTLPTAPINLTRCNGFVFVTADNAIYKAKIEPNL